MTKPSRPSFQNRVAYHATLLGGIATLAAALLVLGNITTRDDIAERKAEDMRASLSQVVLPALHDNMLLDSTLTIQHEGEAVTVYQARKNKQVTALAFQVTGIGYAGEIVIMMAVDAEGQVLGVRVLSHAETPGLGDKIEIEKDHWITGFNGLSTSNTPAAEWAVKKDGGRFDQFSGATITPRGVVAAVKSGLDFFNNHRALLLQIQSQQATGAGHE